jgi:hypothetical protein
MTDKRSAVFTPQLRVECIQPGLPDEVDQTLPVSAAFGRQFRDAGIMSPHRI